MSLRKKIPKLFILMLFSIASVKGIAQTISKKIKSIEKNKSMAITNDYKIFKSGNGLLFKSAFIKSDEIIEFRINEPKKFKPSEINVLEYDYTAKDSFSDRFQFINPQTPHFEYKNDTLIYIHLPNLDFSKNYVIAAGEEFINVYLDPAVGGILDTTFNASDVNDFGVRLKYNNAYFTLWSPPAARIELLLFDEHQTELKTKQLLLMSRDSKGVWRFELKPEMLINPRSLEGLYYQYRVFAYGKSTIALDPFAFSMAAFNPNGSDNIGKAAIVDMKSPKAKGLKKKVEFFNSKVMANENDVIAYEAHIRDYTIQPGVVKSEIAGTFSGFCEKIHHLTELGITHVQFMPVMNFYTVNEYDRSYKGTDAPESNYNWGYDSHHFFSLEGWFSTNPENPYTRIAEFKDLVNELHSKKIGVILDVVYNHCYAVETFENVATGCYFRLDSELNISKHTGAGPGIETRRNMVRKLILESLKFYVKEYNVDGFRFDLMGFIDQETIMLIRQEVGKIYNSQNVNDLILQGEAWVFSDLDTSSDTKGIHAATTKINFPKENINVGFFNDTSRDSYTGRLEQRGFVQGEVSEMDRVAAGIVGGLRGYKPGAVSFNTDRFINPYNLFAEYPNNCLNYLSIHDGMTLWDKINASWPDSTGFVRARLMKQANVLLFTSQGKIILHGGDEILRTKPLSTIDKEKNRAINTIYTDIEDGAQYFHENSYCSPDFTNMFRWDRLNNQYAPITRSMKAYYQGLISIRRALPGLRMKVGENIQKGVRFMIDNSDKSQLPNLYSDFYDTTLTELNFKFINGPKSITMYLAGEVHRVGLDGNPVENPFEVTFDSNGSGKIRFTREQINQFDLGKWSDKRALHIKLVKHPGSWLSIDEAYTSSGNNVVRPEHINKKMEVVIDLSVKDFSPGQQTPQFRPVLTYIIDNTLEKDSKMKPTNVAKILVIHNVSNDNQEVLADITNESKWKVICDAYQAGLKPLKYDGKNVGNGYTDVLVKKGKVLIPGHTSAIIIMEK